MKRIIAPIVLLALASAMGCHDNDNCDNVTCPSGQTCDANTGMCTGPTDRCAGVTCTSGQTCDSNTGMCVTGTPGVPTLGMQIDRMGRPAINTALTNPFGLVKTPGTQTVETTGMTQDNYNHDTNVANWPAQWSPYIRFNLAIYDGLDGVCGNQFLADVPAGSPRYSTLATALANDMLQLDSSQTTCSQYLGVELAATVMPGLKDCGGRKLDYAVVDVSYNVLVVGSVTGSITNGVVQTTVPSPTFPFMVGPM